MMDLFKAIGLGLVVLLPLANPLTTVALFLGLAGNMNSAERNRQSLMASVYVFAIMMVAYYAGQLVMNTFGISIPGLRIAGDSLSRSSVSVCCFLIRRRLKRRRQKAKRRNWKMNLQRISPLFRWRCQALPGWHHCNDYQLGIHSTPKF